VNDDEAKDQEEREELLKLLEKEKNLLLRMERKLCLNYNQLDEQIIILHRGERNQLPGTFLDD
jgi:hypothetical protein